MRKLKENENGKKENNL